MKYSDEQEQNAYKPITENPIVLDFSACCDVDEIHEVLKEAFGLPEYYGENWDALWDCLRDYWWNAEPSNVKIYGITALEKSLQDECAVMLEVFDDVHEESPNVTFTVIS